MENKVSLKLPLGYKIIRETETVNIWEAERILTSKRRNRYIQANRKDTSAELIEDVLICPICNSRYPANTRNKMFHHFNDTNKSLNFDNIVRSWSDTQLSFFDEYRSPNLYISSPIRKPESFTCPKCNKQLKYSEKERQVDIISRKKKIVVKCEIMDISEIFSINWLPNNLFSISFPMYEIVIFDFAKGRISAKLKSKNDDVLSVRDITDHPEFLTGDVVGNSISNYKLVNRIIKRFFAYNWGNKLPFDGSYITVVDFFKMTMFVGYTKEFYDYIPYKLRTYSIETSFKKIASKIKNAQNIVNVYEGSTLPNVKSIRKICFERPGVFFYLEELERLSEIIDDSNVFCSLLKSTNIMDVLLELHIRPQIIEYFIDYISVKGNIAFVKGIEKLWCELRYEAIDYISMSNDIKSRIRCNWHKKNYFKERRWNDTYHSIPMMQPLKEIKDCTIDGYKFYWLRNSNDYISAGDKLKNCLGRWCTSNWPVVCIKKQERYVAAVEISETGIEQAFAFDNRRIESDEPLFKVFEKWRKLNNLEINYCYEEDDE